MGNRCPIDQGKKEIDYAAHIHEYLVSSTIPLGLCNGDFNRRPRFRLLKSQPNSEGRYDDFADTELVRRAVRQRSRVSNRREMALWLGASDRQCNNGAVFWCPNDRDQRHKEESLALHQG